MNEFYRVLEEEYGDGRERENRAARAEFSRAVFDLCRASRLTLGRTAERAGGSRAFMENAYFEKNAPAREDVVQLAFALGMGLPAAQELLKRAGFELLDPLRPENAAALNYLGNLPERKRQSALRPFGRTESGGICYGNQKTALNRGYSHFYRRYNITNRSKIQDLYAAGRRSTINGREVIPCRRIDSSRSLRIGRTNRAFRPNCLHAAPPPGGAG